jgi:DNA polymerase
MPPSPSPRELLKWYVEAGVDETISDRPVNRLNSDNAPDASSAADPKPDPAPASTPVPVSAPPSAPLSVPPSAPLSAPPSADAPAGLADAGQAPFPAPPVVGPRAPARPPAQRGLFADAAAPARTADGDVSAAVHQAQVTTSVEELRLALEAFDGCALKRTATNLVFTDGNPKAPLLLIGEAPGAEEDRQGLPFVGPSGRLLDKMLESIGLDRGRVLISNTVFWRPPGNRTPTSQETAVCMPFLERLIELVDPQILVALGGPAAKAVLAQTTGVGRLRGKWFSYSTARLVRPIAATAMFHPAYLLRSPGQKRDTWRDLLEIKRRLAEMKTAV